MLPRIRMSLILMVLVILFSLFSLVFPHLILLFLGLAFLCLAGLLWQLLGIWSWYADFKKVSQLSQSSCRRQAFSSKHDDLRSLAKAINTLEDNGMMREQDRDDKILHVRTFLEHLSMGAFVVTRNKQIELQSQSLGNFFPSLDHKTFKTLADLRRSDLTVLVNRAFDQEQVLKKELVGLNDSDLILEVTVVPIPNPQCQYQRALVFLNDLTPLRLYEQQNMDFVANASHELRTPVTSIKGFTETLLEMPADEEQQVRKDFLGIIQKESARLEHIVNHMLSLSKLHQMKPQLESFDVVPFLKDLMQTLQPKIVAKGLDYHLNLPQKLIYETDAHMLSQIMVNLLTNAIRYTEEGGQISLSLIERDNCLEISVADTGIGIGSYQLERIFERFYRVNKGRSRQTGGTGLGLAIVKSFSEILGGRIQVSSQVGQGSTFTLILPITIGLGS